MLNIFMKRKKAILFIIFVVVLFALNKFLMNANNIAVDEMPDLVNNSHVSSQKLFDNTWDTVLDNYYDPSMNHQQWKRWKEHYRGKIKTDEDAKVAIDTMLASLNDPYSRYMSKSEYNEQNTSKQTSPTQPKQKPVFENSNSGLIEYDDEKSTKTSAPLPGA